LAKKTGLGRGLGAILEEVEEAYINDIKQGAEIISDIEIDTIKPNPFQPRKVFDEHKIQELSLSIKEHGLLQPIIVSKKDDEYILIAGERRLRASKLAGFKTIRAIVANIDIDKLQETALLENIQREDLNAIELASTFEELIKKHSLTHDELAKKIHKSRTFVTNVLRLLSLSDFTKKMIEQNKITSGHAKVLIGLQQEEEEKVVHSIINQN
jgi:ParB family chromosome partitioning protein